MDRAVRARARGTQPVSEILVDAGGYGIVAACRLQWMQMVIDRIVQSREASIVEEGRLQAHVSKGRAAKLVTIGRISRDLLEPEVFVFTRPVKDHIPFSRPKLRSDLRYADDMHLEIAEHLVGVSSDGVTAHASGFSEKQDGAFLFRDAHGPGCASRETIDGRVSEHERK